MLFLKIFTQPISFWGLPVFNMRAVMGWVKMTVMLDYLCHNIRDKHLVYKLQLFTNIIGSTQISKDNCDMMTQLMTHV